MLDAIKFPGGGTMMALILMGLVLLVGLALTQDIDLAIFFATKLSGILLVLGGLYFFAERLARRAEQVDGRYTTSERSDIVWCAADESDTYTVANRDKGRKNVARIWGYSRPTYRSNPG